MTTWARVGSRITKDMGSVPYGESMPLHAAIAMAMDTITEILPDSKRDEYRGMYRQTRVYGDSRWVVAPHVVRVWAYATVQKSYALRSTGGVTESVITTLGEGLRLASRALFHLSAP